MLADDPAAQAEKQALLRHITNRATETAAAAHFVARYEESKEAELLLLHSSQRTDGVLLEALIAADPGNDLIPKLARGLLGHRVRGRWSNTQETRGRCWHWTATSPPMSARFRTSLREPGWEIG